jgi:hypothetical protein
MAKPMMPFVDKRLVIYGDEELLTERYQELCGDPKLP